VKNRIITTVCLLCGELVACGQGYMSFDNLYVSPVPAAITISSALGTYNPADGPAGAYVGSNYTASLYFENGTITGQAVFDSSDPMLFASADVAFFGTTGTGTGHGLSGDFSGFFDGGVVYLSAATNLYGPVTVEVRAWYNGGGAYTSYDQALAAGQNVGESNPVSLYLADPTYSVPEMNGLLPFTVGVPEPTEWALLGLSGLAWLKFRQRMPKFGVQKM
jgi:hypothetical protein